MKYFIANWKAHKNVKESMAWVYEFKDLIKKDKRIYDYLKKGAIKVIICPPYPLLESIKNNLTSVPNLSIGAQDISTFDSGSYTGEVSAYTLKDLAKYVIIGHSERRSYFHESDEIVAGKIAQSFKYNITPILCVRDHKDEIVEGAKIVAYEPPEYIGTGKTQELDQILTVRKKIKLDTKSVFLYGAGVTEDTVQEYLASSEIDGLLVGSVSLDPLRFYKLLTKYETS